MSKWIYGNILIIFIMQRFLGSISLIFPFYVPTYNFSYTHFSCLYWFRSSPELSFVWGNRYCSRNLLCFIFQWKQSGFVVSCSDEWRKCNDRVCHVNLQCRKVPGKHSWINILLFYFFSGNILFAWRNIRYLLNYVEFNFAVKTMLNLLSHAGLKVENRMKEIFPGYHFVGIFLHNSQSTLTYFSRNIHLSFFRKYFC